MLEENLEGAVYSSAKIKIKCKDCKYNSYIICDKFKPKKHKYTGERRENFTYKKDLNKEGLCKHFKKKSFLQGFFA